MRKEEDRSLEDALSTAKLLQRELQDAESVPDEPPRFIRARLEGDLMGYMGDVYSELEDHKLAIAHHRKELSIAEANSFTDMRLRALRKLGVAHAARAEHRRAVASWDAYLAVVKNTEERAQALKNQSLSFVELGETQKAVETSRLIVAEADKAHLKEWSIEGRVLVGKALALLNDFQSSMDEFEHALVLAREMEDQELAKDIIKEMEHVNSRVIESLVEATEHVRPEKYAAVEKRFTTRRDEHNPDNHKSTAQPTTPSPATAAAASGSSLVPGSTNR
jgi:tetratricopeptide (TPR) repeat protein